MRELVNRLPEVDAFLALAPEELAAKMLFLMRQRYQSDFPRDSLENEPLPSDKNVNLPTCEH